MERLVLRAIPDNGLRSLVEALLNTPAYSDFRWPRKGVYEEKNIVKVGPEPCDVTIVDELAPGIEPGQSVILFRTVPAT